MPPLTSKAIKMILLGHSRRTDAFKKRSIINRNSRLGEWEENTLFKCMSVQHTSIAGQIFQMCKKHFPIWSIVRLDEAAIITGRKHSPFFLKRTKAKLKRARVSCKPLLTAGDTRVPLLCPPLTHRPPAPHVVVMLQLARRHFSTTMASSSLSCFIESWVWVKDRYG